MMLQFFSPTIDRLVKTTITIAVDISTIKPVDLFEVSKNRTLLFEVITLGRSGEQICSG
jgi:hypothetical protein